MIPPGRPGRDFLSPRGEGLPAALPGGEDWTGGREESLSAGRRLFGPLAARGEEAARGEITNKKRAILYIL